jgi:hypothetical protein
MTTKPLETCIRFTFLPYSAVGRCFKVVLTISYNFLMFVQTYGYMDDDYGCFTMRLKSSWRVVTSHEASSQVPVAVTPM